MAHETLERSNPVKVGTDRSFGFVFTVVFLLAATWLFFKGREGWYWPLLFAGLFFVVALSRPRLLGPLNRLWMQFGALLHKIVSPVILGVLFFLVVTPTGWIMRGLGHDLLRLRRDKKAESYWIERDPVGPAPGSLKDQF